MELMHNKLSSFILYSYRMLKIFFHSKPPINGFETLRLLGNLGAKFDLPKKCIGSVDITYKCNLRCKHCYFFKQEYRACLSDEEWIELFSRRRERGELLFHCTWIGGEPLLRFRLLEKLVHFFYFNIVITNGTLGFPALPKTKYHVSVDGPQHIHDKLRGSGSYYLIWRNIKRASSCKIGIVTTLNKINVNYIEDIVKEWIDTPIKYILFEFYTPLFPEDEHLSFNFEERRRVAEKLWKLKEIYGDFILNPYSLLELILNEKHIIVTNNCIKNNTELYFYYDVLGREKNPCVLGPGVECYKCGCSMPYYKFLVENQNIEAMISLWRFAF